jgi:hypothetical protein
MMSYTVWPKPVQTLRLLFFGTNTRYCLTQTWYPHLVAHLWIFATGIINRGCAQSEGADSFKSGIRTSLVLFEISDRGISE